MIQLQQKLWLSAYDSLGSCAVCLAEQAAAVVQLVGHIHMKFDLCHALRVRFFTAPVLLAGFTGDCASK